MSSSRYLLAVVLFTAVSAGGQQLPELLLPLASTGDVKAHEEQMLSQLTKEQGAVGGRLMTLNRPMLAKLAPGARMSLALTPGDTETVTIESAATDAAGVERVTGQMQGTAQTSFLLVVDKSGAAATVDMGERFYEITSVDANTVAVIQIDRSLLPDEEGDEPLDDVRAPAETSSASPPAAKKGVTTFRLMIVFTPQAATDAGGADAVRRQANLGVMQMNTAFVQSNIKAVAVLAAVNQVSLAESGTPDARLAAAIASADVKKLRATAKADVVSAFMATLSPRVCGLANVFRGNPKTFAPQAFSVVKRSCATNGYSFAHEVGHNLGSAHNVETGGKGTFDYSHGFRVFTETTGQKRKGFRSVMAYACTRKSDPNNCARVLYYSNPDVTYTGRATGSAAANNARSINNTIGDVATFFSKLPKTK